MPNVLITGANRGIGLEFARQYAGDGWEVIATARDPGNADQLKAFGVRIEQLDLNDMDAAVGFGERLDGTLDLLISNAGVMEPERAQTAADGRAWGEMLTTNVIAPYLLARSCLDRVAVAKGKLIAISSGMGSIGESSGGYVPYRTSKAALNMAWHSLATDAKRLGIVAAVFDPGWVKTRMGGQNAPLQPQDSVADMRRLIERLGPEHSGKFLKRDGSEHAW